MLIIIVHASNLSSRTGERIFNTVGVPTTLPGIYICGEYPSDPWDVENRLGIKELRPGALLERDI